MALSFFRASVLPLALLAACAAPAAADDAATRAVVDPIAGGAIGGQCAGLAVGVNRGGTASEQFYGKSGTRRPLDGKTEFEIDSVTKTFTALVLALATAAPDHAMALDDPLQKYAPPGVKLPTFNGAPIRLVDLATHTAGLPRKEIGDPHQSAEETWKYAAGLKLASAPGTTYLYSNLGFGLLGLAEEHAEKAGLEQIFEQQITDPLGMPDTRMILSPEQMSRKAEGHHPNGSSAPFDTPRTKMGIAGAFALNSTLDDMMHYLALQMGQSGTDALKQAALVTQKPLHPIGPKGQVGLAWNTNRLNDGTPVINKDGTGPGFTAFVAFTPSTDNGVVVIGNQLSCPVSKVSFSILFALDKAGPG